MKRENASFSNQILLIMIPASLALGLTVISCQKSSLKTAGEKADLVTVARQLEGQASTGNISVQTGDNAISINYDNGKRWIEISKIPGIPIDDMSSVRSATIITSKYGVVLKDLRAGKTWFLVNNDQSSEDKFKAVNAQSPTGVQSSKIFGTMVVNPENS